MGANFSVWLRESGRLYLRYMAVGVASLPFAAGAAFAKEAGWNERIALPILLSLGIISASLVWRWLGDWRIRPAVSVGDHAWADLLSVGGGDAVMLYQVSRTRVTWADALAPLNAIGSEMVLFAPSEQPTQSYPVNSDIFRELLAGSRRPQSVIPRNSKTANEPPQTQGQSAPLPPFWMIHPLPTATAQG